MREAWKLDAGRVLLFIGLCLCVRSDGKEPVQLTESCGFHSQWSWRRVDGTMRWCYRQKRICWSATEKNQWRSGKESDRLALQQCPNRADCRVWGPQSADSRSDKFRRALTLEPGKTLNGQIGNYDWLCVWLWWWTDGGTCVLMSPQ